MSELSLGQIKGLPVNSNVVTVPSGHTLYAPGHVLQVVNTTYGFETTTTSTSFVTTGLNATITPKFSTSKILAIASIASARNDNSSAALYITLFRGTVSGTNLGTNFGFGRQYSASGLSLSNLGFSYLDSPNTTSAVTYTVGFRSDSVNQVAVQTPSGMASTLTLMEIAA